MTTTTGFGGGSSRSKKATSKRKPGKSNHRREQCPMGRDPDIDAIKALSLIHI